MEDPLFFEPSAYMQRLLGRELISNEYMAVAEIVKNAYDAKAREVTIELVRKPEQKIIITDNGRGMNLEEFKKLWMMPGYSEKDVAQKDAGRPLLGEKGIGRFATDKLARRITVSTKKWNDDKSLIVSLDWDEFEDRSKKMSEIPVHFTFDRLDFLPKNRNGTRLELQSLRKVWSRSDWNKLRSSLQNLVSPYQASDEFAVFANAAGWESGEVLSPFESGDSYKYEFSLSRHGIYKCKISRPKTSVYLTSAKDGKVQKMQRPVPSFGAIKGRFYYVNSPNPLKRRGFDPGIGIYRDEFRVEPYGRSDDDWLEVKARKASRQGHAPINPSRLFGFVAISRKDNPDLRDVTNREGILSNHQFAEFRDFVIKELAAFSSIVEKESEGTAESYQAQQATKEKQVKLRTFDQIASELAHQLTQPIHAIGTEAGNLEKILEKQHLLAGDIAEVIDAIKYSVKAINDHINLMRKRALASKAKATKFDLVSWLRQDCEMHSRSYAESRVDVEFETEYEQLEVMFSESVLRFVLDVVMDNAKKAATLTTSDGGRIVLRLASAEGFVCRILVRDNGVGLPQGYRDRLFEAPVESTTDGSGNGLLWSYELLQESNGGVISIVDEFPGETCFAIALSNQEARSE